jgi:hypothetical protein
MNRHSPSPDDGNRLVGWRRAAQHGILVLAAIGAFAATAVAQQRETLAQQGLVQDAGTPQALTTQIVRDITKWKDVISKAGIKPE